MKCYFPFQQLSSPLLKLSYYLKKKIYNINIKEFNKNTIKLNVCRYLFLEIEYSDLG
jgi:hypothetical protein